MENRLDTVSVMKDILRDASTGLWCLEMDPGKPPRLYADDTFREMMRMDAGLSPEDCCRHWLDRIDPGDTEKIHTAVEDMSRGDHAEILYAWDHPEKGLIYIRCGGRKDPEYTRGLRLRGCHQDVSELARVRMEMQRRLEEIARRSADKDHPILNALPGGVGVIRHEPDGRIVPEFLSEGFAAMTGMTLEDAWELYRTDAMNGVYPDDREKLAQALDAYFRSGQENTELTYRLHRGDGSWFWVRNSMTTVSDGSGVRRVYCVYRDITRELEERENLRRKYEDRLSQHYRTVGPDVLATGHCDITHNRLLELVDYTPGRGLTGFNGSRDEFIRDICALVPDADERRSLWDALRRENLLKRYAEGKQELSQVCFLRLKEDDHGRYASFKLTLLPDPDSRDMMGFLRITDVTEATVTRKILQKLSSLGSDMVLDVDLFRDAVSVVAIHDRQPSSSVPGGYAQSVRNVLEFVVHRDRAQVRKMLEPKHILKTLKSCESYSFLYSIAVPGKAQRTKRMTVSAIDLRLGRVCLVRADMTETLEAERRTQDALEKALETAEAANRAKNDFLSSMSHDIRTPLNAITGMTLLAKSHLDDRQKLSEYLENITQASAHLLSLINDILDMNKIERSKLTLHREVTSTREILRKMQSMFTIQAADNGLAFRVECQGAAEREFYTDPLRLHQVLINLLGNAVKFTPTGGSVRLAARELPAGEGNVKWCFTVSDTGPGIPDDLRGRLFQPFSRGDNTDAVEGTGLGLAIVKGLVNLMGGTIDLESRVGAGSSFRVELELEAADGLRAAETAPTPEAEEAQPLLGLRLLAAEDNALNADILRELMVMNGARIRILENGRLALEEFRAAPPGTYDAVLLDIQMPELNGYDTARAIRALPRPDAAEIPIIAMTANAFADDVRAALDAGMDAHTAKPLDLPLFIRVLKETIRKKKHTMV